MSGIELTAKEILETGNIRQFEEFIVHNSDKINIKATFNDNETFLILLVQTFRNAESNLIIDRSLKLPLDDFKNCMAFLVEIGCELNAQDTLGRSVGHWCILLQALELLGVALRLGCDARIQDNEGQTIVHLSIRHSNQMALETIKLYTDAEDSVFECASQTSGATPLIYAVQIGSVDLVQKLLQLNVEVDAQEQNKYKRTALHYALFTENEEIFELLLKYKAKSDIRDYKDKSVIDRVAEHPKDSFLRIITHYSSSEIFSSTDANSANKMGYSPILTACKNSDYDMLCDLLAKTEKKMDLLTTDGDKRTPLHYCTDNNDISCAKKLIEMAPELVNMKDQNGFTSLHLATISNNIELIKLLLKHGGNVCDKDNDGHTCLHWAVVCSTKNSIGLLVENSPEIIGMTDNHGASALHYATQAFLSPEGSVQGPNILEELLKIDGVDINCVDSEGRTALLWAASLGIVDCCHILLEKGADISHRDNNGLSALHCAASRGNYDVVDLLLSQYSMPVDCEDNNLCTALFYAVTLKHVSIIHLLLEYNSNPNQQDIKGRSIAHCAALKGYCDILDLIRKKGGSICLINKNGDLPLHEAAETGHVDVCETLCSKMQECGELDGLIDSLNSEGLSPLHMAARNNHGKVCKVLLDYGAQVDLSSGLEVVLPGQSEAATVVPLDLATDASTIKLLKMNQEVTCEEGEKAAIEPVIVMKRSNSLNIRKFSLSFESLNEAQKSKSKSLDLIIVENRNMEEKEEIPIKSNGNKEEVENKGKINSAALELKANEFRTHNNTQLKPINGLDRKELNTAPEHSKRGTKMSSNGSASTGSSSRNSDIHKSRPRTQHKNGISRKNGHTDIQSRVILSVREYLDSKSSMQKMADQKRCEMFHGFGRSLELSRNSNQKSRSHQSGRTTMSSNRRIKSPGKYSVPSSSEENDKNSNVTLPVIYTTKPTSRTTPRKSGSQGQMKQIKSTYKSDRLLLL